jgi:pyridoxal phosphate enzyme (YggS family)
MRIKDNINNLRGQIPNHCRLIAVSKTHPVEKILEAYDAGQRIFGENKVQELGPKYEALPRDIEWHMIGHMQSNKVKYIAPFIHLIHSVDSLSLLREIDKQAKKNQRNISCLLQIHIAAEETKFGFSENEVLDALEASAFDECANVVVTGLMGMATFTDDKDLVRGEFRNLKLFFDQLKARALPANVSMQELSMGMSSDFNVAIEEGSTMVRVGSAIFGERSHASQT